MELPLIMAALRKHLIPAVLVILETALACAVLSNAVFMIGQRVQEMHISNAIDEAGIVVINVQGTDPNHFGSDAESILAALRNIPGVIGASAVDFIPLNEESWNLDIATSEGGLSASDNPGAAQYAFTQGGPESLGLHLLRGRLFSAVEYGDSTMGDNYYSSGHVVIITSSLADRLWPGQSALGKEIWLTKDNAYTVVGVIADVLRPSQAGGGLIRFHRAIFFPAAPSGLLNNFVVRSLPQDRNRILHDATTAIEAQLPTAVVKAQTFSEIRDKYFATARNMVWMLVQVCIVMLAVTAFSIVGLTSFWVGQRHRQIGIRRTLGATRTNILQYFQLENLLLSTVGIVVGTALAFATNIYLMERYQMERMPWYYAPISAILLWFIGQVSVLNPALRAARVPPIVATRAI